MPWSEPPTATLMAALVRAAASPRGLRFIDRDEGATWLGYRELLAEAQRVGRALIALGVRPRDQVALVLPTSPEFAAGFFGVLWAGAVPVPLYPPVRLGRLEEYHQRTAAMLRAADVRLVLTDSRIRRLLGEAVWRAAVPLGCHLVAELNAAGDPTLAVAQADEPALVQFSSGSTAAPKPVVLTHRQVLANTRAILGAIMRAHPESAELTHAGVSWLPLYHDMGLIGCLLVAVDHPGDLTLIPPELFVARPALWLRTIAKYGGTISPAPNFAYALCADRISDAELVGVDLRSWRVALNGAEPVTPAVLRRFVDRFAGLGLRPEALTPVYGLAEAALAVTFSPLTTLFSSQRFSREGLLRDGVARATDTGLELVNLGTPLGGFAVRIVDDNDELLPADRLGRVLVRGPSLMQGYLGMPEETQRVLRQGWLDTGDTGFLHDGDLFLYGRAKDLIVIRGRNWAPQDIEQLVDEVAGTRPGCCAAVGVVGEEGESLVVLAEHPHGTPDPELGGRIRRHLVSRLGLTARVEVLEPGTLPRTSSGKIRRNEARTQFEAASLKPPVRMTPLRLARALVASSVKMWQATHDR